MARYRETFRRHPVRFSLPIIVSIAFAAWFAFGSPRVYRSTASVWIDNGPVEGSSLEDLSVQAAQASMGLLTGPVGPAPIEQVTLKEQLSSPMFDQAVGEDSLLPRYLASGARQGFSPTVLLKHGGVSIQYEVMQAIQTGVTTSSPGPEVLRVAYSGPTPAVAQSVLKSLLAHLKSNSTIYGNDFAQTEAMFFEQTATVASRAAVNAAATVASYKSEHPSASVDTDPIYAALRQSAKKTSSALTAATAAVNSIHQGSTGMNAVIRVIDPPSLPSGPTVSTGQTALSLVGGLVAGLLMSLVAVVPSTPTVRRWDSELSTAPWMRLRWDRRASAAARLQHARACARRRRRSAGILSLRRPS
jgi:hypothetical protein